MKKMLVASLALARAIVPGLPETQAATTPTDTRVVPTYEAAGLYWSSPPGATAATGCEVKFRKVGDSAWTQGLNLWLDVRDGECRGSLVNLAAGTDYEAQLNLPGQPPARTVTFKTWPNEKPVSKTIVVTGGSATLDITEGGSAAGYVVYQGAPGAVLDAGNAAQFNVTVNAPYVIVRGLVLKGAQQDAIRISPDVHDVVIEDNEITGWGRLRSGTWGMDLDAGIRAICQAPTLERVTIQRNEIHDPRYSANSWSDGHPAGPQAITFSFCGGNHVIRHNEMFSTTGRHFNDVIGGEDNDSKTGFPNADSDIYGNDLSSAWDDGIEAEGGNKNVRIWGNYLDQTGTGIATTMNSVGPSYLFRNVYNRSRILEKSPLDQDDRQVMFKSGSDPALGDGRRYVFHNTMLQATQAGVTYGLGASGGISGTGATSLTNNTVSRNNIFQNWRTWTAYYDIGVGNDFANDLYNGSAGAPDVGGIAATPVYAAGNGWQSESGGMYALAAGTRGYDQAARIANFNDVFAGAGPDVGAAEAGMGPMKFGIAASPGPSVAKQAAIPAASPERPDFNGDGSADILWRNASNGQDWLWMMNGASIASQGAVPSLPAPWAIQFVGDMNGDGKADILWRNMSTGQPWVWIMNGTSVAANGPLPVLADLNWQIAGLADMDGDGRADVMWRNTATGQNWLWTMDASGMGIASQGPIASLAPGWEVQGVRDMNGDHKADILWRNAATGQPWVWIMDANNVVANGPLPTLSDLNWKIVGLGDFNADGRADVMWRNGATGQNWLWMMDASGLAIASQGAILALAPGWDVQSLGDANGDGKADITWRNAASGQPWLWTMDANTVAASASLPVISDLNWQIVKAK